MAECERIENYPDMAGIVLASLWALQPPTADEALGFIRDLAPVSIAMHQGLGCVLIQKVGPPETFVSASKRAGIGNNLVELWEDQPYFILNVEENREKRRRILSWALTMTDPTEALELLDETGLDLPYDPSTARGEPRGLREYLLRKLHEVD